MQRYEWLQAIVQNSTWLFFAIRVVATAGKLLKLALHPPVYLAVNRAVQTRERVAPSLPPPSKSAFPYFLVVEPSLGDRETFALPSFPPSRRAMFDNRLSTRATTPLFPPLVSTPSSPSFFWADVNTPFPALQSLF